MITIYNYSSVTGEYLDSSIADESPLEPNVPLLPAYSTEIAPPTAPEHKAAVFKDGGWSLEDDYRGTVYWLPDYSQHVQRDLGPLPPDATLEPPTPTLDQTIVTINAAVQKSLDEGAAKWGYNSIVSAATYATSTNPQYAADAAALIQWRDDVWDWAYPKYAGVTPGETPEEFMVDMPKQPAQPKP